MKVAKRTLSFKILSIQIDSVSQIYDQFSKMKIFEGIEKTEVIDGYIEVVRYCQRYFNYEKIDKFELWHKILLLCESKKEWYSVCLIIEICLCTPCSNATLERFFSHLKFIKTDQRTALSAGSLNAIMRIKLRGTSITEFSEKFLDKVVIHWYNEKERRIHQKERKQYKQRVSAKKAREQFDIDKFTSEIESSDDDELSENEESSSSSYEEDFSDYE